MAELPEIRYARSGNYSIAYSRWGRGDHMIVFTPPLVSNIELMWELPEWERVLNWAGQNHQIIMIDKRGVGVSDRTSEPTTLMDNVGDVLAVMDAEGLDSTNIVGLSEGGMIGLALAAEHPERVRRLCIMGVNAMGVDSRLVSSFLQDGEAFPTEEESTEYWHELIRFWGKPESVFLEKFVPSAAADPRIRRWSGKFERQSCSPGSLLVMLRSVTGFDIEPYLKRIKAPTMVGHSKGDQVAHVANGRAIAALIPGAKLIEWENPDHMWNFAPNWRDCQNDIIEFITGSRPGSGARKQIATVLFTDIVESTKQASALGDGEWRKVMELHNSITQSRVSAYDGTVIQNTGDGTLATFPDPDGAVTAARELSRELAASGISIRAGLHTGQIEVRDDGDISGIAVNIAARVQALAEGGEVLVSQTVRDMLMGSETAMTDKGEHQLKGVDGLWHVYAAGGGGRSVV